MVYDFARLVIVALLLLNCVYMTSAFRFSRVALSAVPRAPSVGRIQQMVLFSTSEVSAAAVKELRERSGAPMMDCKKALMADGVNGDMAKAIDYLRKKGLAKAQSSV